MFVDTVKSLRRMGGGGGVFCLHVSLCDDGEERNLSSYTEGGERDVSCSSNCKSCISVFSIFKRKLKIYLLICKL